MAQPAGEGEDVRSIHIGIGIAAFFCGFAMMIEGVMEPNNLKILAGFIMMSVNASWVHYMYENRWVFLRGEERMREINRGRR